MTDQGVADAVASALAVHGPRIVAALARRYRDIEAAEEALQDAALAALETWEETPDRPDAWLYRVARNRLLDSLRAVRRRSELPIEEVRAEEPAARDQVALLFAVCHPSIAPERQVGLALRTLCGLDTASVARAFLRPPAVMARELSLASQKIRDAGVPFEVPLPNQRAARVGGVLSAIYLLFNEGYLATGGEAVLRPEVCEAAIDLGERVAALLPEEPEIRGLVALMRLHHARRDARVDDEGALVPLDRQDRTRWRSVEIERASELLEEALEDGRPGPYQIQAAIAALHATARRATDTDWVQITALYGVLLSHQPTAVVELNAAVALAMSAGPERGLAWLDRLDQRGVLDDFHLLPAARGDLLEKLGRHAEARRAFLQALAKAAHPRERALLRERLDKTAGRRRRRQPTGRRRRLTGREWQRVADLFPRRTRGRPARSDRELLEAVLWVLGRGEPWRALPARYGPWQTAYHRFRLWESDGRMARVYERLADHPAARVGQALSWAQASG